MPGSDEQRASGARPGSLSPCARSSSGVLFGSRGTRAGVARDDAGSRELGIRCRRRAQREHPTVGSRASVAQGLTQTQLSDSVIGEIRFDRNGDLIGPSVTILRVKARDGISRVEKYEGAAIDRVIRPPAPAVR